MRRALAASALCVVAAGCAELSAIQAYPGSARGKGEVGIVETDRRADDFVIVDNRIVAVDSVRYEKGGYEARMLPGVHRIGLQGALLVSPQARVQYCAFDLNVLPGCTYRPTIPAYPRARLAEAPDAEWRVTRVITVLGECTDTSYAVQVPMDCSSRP